MGSCDVVAMRASPIVSSDIGGQVAVHGRSVSMQAQSRSYNNDSMQI